MAARPIQLHVVPAPSGIAISKRFSCTINTSNIVGLLIAALGGAAVGLECQWSGHAEGPGARFAGIRTFTMLGAVGGLRSGVRFAVMALVVLPLLPEGPYGPLGGIRPREIWALVLFSWD